MRRNKLDKLRMYSKKRKERKKNKLRACCRKLGLPESLVDNCDTEQCLKTIKILLQTSSLTKKIACSEEDYYAFRKENHKNISTREKLEEMEDRTKTRQNR